MCEIGIIYFVLSCCMIKRIYVCLNVNINIYNIHVCTSWKNRTLNNSNGHILRWYIISYIQCIYIYLFIICIKYKQAKCNTYNKCSNLFLNDLSGLFSHDSTRGTEELDCQWPRWHRRRPLEAEGTWTFSICFPCFIEDETFRKKNM